MRPVDRRLQGHAPAARGHLVLAAGLAAGSAALLVVQAFAVTELVVRPFQQGAGVAALRTPLLVLGGVVLGRALLAWASEVSAHRASARVKSQLRHQLLEHVVRLGPAWLAQQRTGDLATLATRGTDALDGYFARYLPALVAAAIVPPAVLVVILTQDLLDGLIILVTLPLVPVFAMLVGLATQRRTRRRWRTLAALGGHFLDVVEGLPTLLVFRRAAAQVETIRRVTDENRRASMATLRLAFLSSAVLEFVATISVALVAVSTGLRMVGGTLDLHTGLVVLVLAPEAYWPLRQ
ncbi:MAG: ABC transporter transmembrane domain-containing protein, partial [Actinomycetes bacterium]